MKKNIGILGFGIVGKSVLKFLRSIDKNIKISVWDQRKFSAASKDLIKSFDAAFFDSSQIDIEKFIKLHDQVVVSPGINLNKILEPIRELTKPFVVSLSNHTNNAHLGSFVSFDRLRTNGGGINLEFSNAFLSNSFDNKITGELDLFAQFFKKPTIAITGTLGKTTITTTLNQLINNNVYGNQICAQMGGNVGIGMLDLVEQQENLDLAVLELSSFQLQLNKKFAPDIAIWSNFYPNHLDWHTDLREYFDAKFKIFEYQTEEQFALFPAEFLNNKYFLEKIKNIKSQIYFIGNFEEINNLPFTLRSEPLRASRRVHEKDNKLVLSQLNSGKIIKSQEIFDLKLLPDFSFKQNWLFILATLYFLKLDLKLLESYFKENDKNEGQEHRLELFKTINNIDFYNDSKATVIQSTQAALQKLDQKNKPIILILGGLSKGVDRQPLVEHLSSIKNLKKVFVFGTNCKDLSSFETYSSLEQTVSAILQIAQPGDLVLFSPSGASFDLFDNYQHRGEVFKELIYGCSTKQSEN